MAGSKIQAFWNHPAGPKTIHFWAPTFKWVVSIANVADFSKPPEQLSYPHQSVKFVVIAISGLIWSRYSTQIIPSGYMLHDRVLRPAEEGATVDMDTETPQGSES